MSNTASSEWTAKIEAQELRVREETKKLLELQRSRPARKMTDYQIATPEGFRALSTFFAGKEELILIHNMGKKCVYCTTWADGINGFTGHLMNRTSLLLVNGDDVPTQVEFARSRGWNFPMASTRGTSLFKDLGFQHEHKSDGQIGDSPGVSILTRDKDGVLWQRASAGFGPGDLYCSIWNFIGLLPSNVDWSPKYQY